jgi:hypothetical protein
VMMVDQRVTDLSERQAPQRSNGIVGCHGP